VVDWKSCGTLLAGSWTTCLWNICWALTQLNKGKRDFVRRQASLLQQLLQLSNFSNYPTSPINDWLQWSFYYAVLKTSLQPHFEVVNPFWIWEEMTTFFPKDLRTSIKLDTRKDFFRQNVLCGFGEATPTHCHNNPGKFLSISKLMASLSQEQFKMQRWNFLDTFIWT